MKILVTGGAGFIGSAVIRYLINKTDNSVVNVDKLTYAGNLDNVKEASSSSRYSFEKIDVCDGPALVHAFSNHKPDAVLHLAAESHVDRSIDGPAEFIKTNIQGTFTLLEVAKEYWLSLPETQKKAFRFHHVSTDEVFGDLLHPDDVSKDQLNYFVETTPYNPSSPYSASKASSDHLVRAWGRTYNLPIIITNCSNNYGPYHYPEKLIPHVIISALNGQKIPVYGSGAQIRDWLYVDDHAAALYAVLCKGVIGATYNIGGNCEMRNIDVVRSICEVLDEQLPSHFSYTELIKFVPDRPGHDLRYAIDTKKINEKIGWVPRETFISGISKTVEWYLKNTEWWKSFQTHDFIMRNGEEGACK